MSEKRVKLTRVWFSGDYLDMDSPRYDWSRLGDGLWDVDCCLVLVSGKSVRCLVARYDLAFAGRLALSQEDRDA